MYSSYSSSSSAMGRPIVMCFPSPFRSGMSLEDVLLTYPAATRLCFARNAFNIGKPHYAVLFAHPAA